MIESDDNSLLPSFLRLFFIFLYSIILLPIKDEGQNTFGGKL